MSQYCGVTVSSFLVLLFVSLVPVCSYALLYVVINYDLSFRVTRVRDMRRNDSTTTPVTSTTMTYVSVSWPWFRCHGNRQSRDSSVVSYDPVSGLVVSTSVRYQRIITFLSCSSHLDNMIVLYWIIQSYLIVTDLFYGAHCRKVCNGSSRLSRSFEDIQGHSRSSKMASFDNRNMTPISRFWWR